MGWSQLLSNFTLPICRRDHGLRWQGRNNHNKWVPQCRYRVSSSPAEYLLITIHYSTGYPCQGCWYEFLVYSICWDPHNTDASNFSFISFRVMTLWSLVVYYKCFRGTYCVHQHIIFSILKMQTVGFCANYIVLLFILGSVILIHGSKVNSELRFRVTFSDYCLSVYTQFRM